MSMLERVNKWNTEWVREGHINGRNTHNVSATVSIKEHEWDYVGEWMWKNRDTFNGLSVLPYDGGTYQQAPFEEITAEKFNEMYNKLTDIELTKIKESDDNTDLKGELACAGGSCEINI
jgi:ribonucleoside-diphosphate reductase alpha chain